MRWKPSRKVLVAVGFAVAAAMVCGVYVWRRMPLMRFRPVRMDAKQELWASNEILTSKQADNVVAVLQKYGEPFRRADGQTVANFTSVELRFRTGMELHLEGWAMTVYRERFGPTVHDHTF